MDCYQACRMRLGSTAGRSSAGRQAGISSHQVPLPRPLATAWPLQCGGASARPPAAVPDSAIQIKPDQEGPKSRLFGILGQAAEPLTADEMWEAAQGAGLPSKRFTKQMLHQLVEKGLVQARPVLRREGGPRKQAVRHFGYQLSKRGELRMEQRARGNRQQ